MWWMVVLEVPDLGKALAYMDSKDGVHQFFTLDGVPITDQIEAYTTIDVVVSKPTWWTSKVPPELDKFWEEDANVA